MSLRDSMKKLSFSKKKYLKILKLKNGDKVNIKFLPYISSDGEPVSDKTIWYHYNNADKKSYLCEGKFNDCQICESGLKTAQRRYANVQIINSNNVDIKKNDFYIFYIPWYLNKTIEEWEQSSNKVVFSIFSSPEIALISSINDLSGYETLEESFITESLTPMISDIEDYKDEELIEMLKFRTRNLDDVVNDTIEKTSSFKIKDIINKTDESLEIITPIVKSSIKDSNVEEESKIDNDKDSGEIEAIEEVETETIEEVETETIEEIEIETEEEVADDEKNDEEDTLAYINNYLEGIN